MKINNNYEGKPENVEYDIENYGMKATVQIYPELMSPIHYEMLAQELKNFYKTFWGNEHTDWRDCTEDYDDYVREFFNNCKYLSMHGICKNCEEQFDTPTLTRLYYIHKQWVCGECANTWEHEEQEHISRYGVD